MKFKLYQPQAISQLGKRKNQEDTIYPMPGEASVSNRLFLVCDGMGGYDKGEVASAAVCKGLSTNIEKAIQSGNALSDEQFRAALTAAYDTLDAADVEHEGKMGTTMTCICLHKGGVLAAHIGDSRIYHLRPKTGEVRYRSRDHSLVQQLYDLGEISYNDMGTSQRKNIILKAMQPFQGERMDATLVHITDVQPGDYFYLCSDGMLEQMEDEEILSIFSADITDEEKAARLVKATEDNADNHSAYLIHIEEVTREEGDSLLVDDEESERQKSKALHDTRKDEAWDYTLNPKVVEDDEITVSVCQEEKMSQKKASPKSSKGLLVLLALLAVVAAVLIFMLTNSQSKPAGQDDEDDDEPATEKVEKRNANRGSTPQGSIKEDIQDNMNAYYDPEDDEYMDDDEDFEDDDDMEDGSEGYSNVELILDDDPSVPRATPKAPDTDKPQAPERPEASRQNRSIGNIIRGGN